MRGRKFSNNHKMTIYAIAVAGIDKISIVIRKIIRRRGVAIRGSADSIMKLITRKITPAIARRIPGSILEITF